MLIYQQVHKYDLDVLGLILEQIEYADSSNIKKQLAKKEIHSSHLHVRMLGTLFVLSFCYWDLSAWWENRTDQPGT